MKVHHTIFLKHHICTEVNWDKPEEVSSARCTQIFFHCLFVHLFLNYLRNWVLINIQCYLVSGMQYNDYILIHWVIWSASKTSKHLAPYKFVTILLTIFLVWTSYPSDFCVLYVESLPLNSLHPFCLSFSLPPHPMATPFVLCICASFSVFFLYFVIVFFCILALCF